MARHWVGGSGTWDDDSTVHWATSSGGTPGASVPDTSQAVVFGSLSGTDGSTTDDVVVTIPYGKTMMSGAITYANFNGKIQASRRGGKETRVGPFVLGRGD